MEPASNYIKEWSGRLAREKEARQRNTFSAVLVRLGSSKFAFSAPVVREIVEPRKVHRIPHRSNNFLRGIVNIRGILHLCIDLGAILAIEPEIKKRARHYPRMVVLEKEGKAWVFAVDEVISLHRFSPDQIVPFTDTGRLARGILEWQGTTFDVLDENFLFRKLEQSLE